MRENIFLKSSRTITLRYHRCIATTSHINITLAKFGAIQYLQVSVVTVDVTFVYPSVSVEFIRLVKDGKYHI